MAFQLTTEKDSPNGSTKKLVLLSLSLVGLGVLFGFASFYLLFTWRGELLLQEMEHRHESTLQHWETLHNEASNNYTQCMADTRRNVEAEEVKGRLQAQAALAGRHGVLVTQQAGAKNELNRLRDQEAQYAKDVEVLNDKLRDQEAQSTSTIDTLKGQVKDLENRLAQMEQQTMARIENALANQVQEFAKEKDSASETIVTITSSRDALEQELKQNLVDVDALQKERDALAQSIAQHENDTSQLQLQMHEQERRLSHTITSIQQDLKEETVQWMRCQERLTEYENVVKQHGIDIKAKRPPPKQQQDQPCSDDHEECGEWASSGDCESNPAYMSRYCPKSCKFCNDGTKWIDSEAAPTLDDEFASKQNDEASQVVEE